MKFSEIRLHDSAPDVTGAQTATFRDVEADVEPWGLWVGRLLLPWGCIKWALAERTVHFVAGDRMAAFVCPPHEGVSPHDVEQLPEPKRKRGKR